MSGRLAQSIIFSRILDIVKVFWRQMNLFMRWLPQGYKVKLWLRQALRAKRKACASGYRKYPYPCSIFVQIIIAVESWGIWAQSCIRSLGCESSHSMFEVSSAQTAGLSPGKHTLLITFGHTMASLFSFLFFISPSTIQSFCIFTSLQPKWAVFSVSLPAQGFHDACDFRAVDSLLFPALTSSQFQLLKTH